MMEAALVVSAIVVAEGLLVWLWQAGGWGWLKISELKREDRQ